MPIPHLALAVLVAIIWGMNFIFISFCLEEMPPLLLCALRFTFTSIPAIFFIKPPKIPFKVTVTYGLIMFALQFALMFIGMYVGMTVSMAALVMQAQVFFSMFIAAFFLQETIQMRHIVGSLIALSGIFVVASHFNDEVSILGFVCILGSAGTWACGNLITKKYQNINMIALISWSCFIAAIPMIIASFIFESPKSAIESYHHLSLYGAISLLYIIYVATWGGYGIWTWLLRHYPVNFVVPFTFLIPIISIFSSVLILGEELQSWKILASALVLFGLYVNRFGFPKFKSRF